MSLCLRVVATVLALGAAGPVVAQEAAFPQRLPSPGGEVIIPSAGQKRAHDEIGYAPARRVGDVLYVSGLVVFRAEGEGNDVTAFEGQVRRALRQLNQTLRAAGSSLDDVAMLNTFHVWDGPGFAGTRDEQIAVLSKVWREFSQGPRPAWTAVGTSGLLGGEGSIVEIQLIAHSPAPRD
ncbi:MULTISPECIES: Rid family hydrolase [unclassified Brevundimonas]|uniref:Rid family hydrolase n=1 Tax=unclassified Brevundimonas TaxID=2622653 RepID=UPI0025C55176|nr:MULTISPECIES: Rid family hydrolase [unclassified Brevundimonas]